MCKSLMIESRATAKTEQLHPEPFQSTWLSWIECSTTWRVRTSTFPTGSKSGEFHMLLFAYFNIGSRIEQSDYQCDQSLTWPASETTMNSVIVGWRTRERHRGLTTALSVPSWLIQACHRSMGAIQAKWPYVLPSVYSSNAQSRSLNELVMEINSKFHKLKICN